MKKVNVEEIVIDGVTYVPKNSNQKAEELNGMPYTMIRTYSAGVHVGYLKSRKGKEVVLVNSIRIWYWDGANSISQLAMEGTNKPENCKFAMPLSTPLTLPEAIEIFECTQKGKDSIINVPSWKA